jgi:membrane-bound serine protease (ClpP class)
LLAAGLVGIYIELKTPGFGLPGIAGAVCLGIFFFGHHVAGLAGWEDIALIVIGIVLLALEVFVIPGFGIAGISGIICVAAGAFMALIPHLPDIKPIPLKDTDMPTMEVSYVDEALLKLMISFLLIALLVWLLGKILPKTSIYNRLVLDAGLSNDQGYVSSDVEHYRSYLGQEGVARTMLRPAGTAEFGDERLDVVTSGDLIQKGTRVRVIRTEGSRVVVEKVEDKSEEA